MSDLDDLVLRDYDENDTWLMEEHQNTPPAEPPKNPNAVALGRLGGKAGRGHVKARTSEQARQAVMVRWSNKFHCPDCRKRTSDREGFICKACQRKTERMDEAHWRHVGGGRKP